MGLKQLILGKTYGALGSGNVTGKVYSPLYGSIWSQDTATEHFWASHPWSVAGTFKTLYFEVAAPIESTGAFAWTDMTYSLFVNGVASALTVVVPAMGPISGNGFSATATNTDARVTVAPGDILSMVWHSGTITGGVNNLWPLKAWSLIFEADADDESSYGTYGDTSGAIHPFTNIAKSQPLNGGFCFNAGYTPGSDPLNEALGHSIVPLDCTLYRVDMELTDAPGSGEHLTFQMQKNGIYQDGTGGTVDTTLTISNLATTGHATFTLPLSILDRIAWCYVSSSTSPTDCYAHYSVALRADTPGQSALCMQDQGSEPVNSGEPDWVGSGASGWAWSTANAPTPSPPAHPDRYPTTELFMSFPGPLGDSFSLRGFCVNANTSPGASKSYTYTSRKAFADTSSTVTLTGASGDDSVLQRDTGGGILFLSSVTDRLDLQAVGTGAPDAPSIAWYWLMTSDVSPPITSTSYPIRRLRRFALPFDQNKWIKISRVELILQAGVGLSTGQGSDPIVMFRLSRDGGMTWDDELTMSMGKIGEYERRAFLNMLGRARNPVVELTSSDPVFVSWISFTVDYEEGTS